MLIGCSVLSANFREVAEFADTSDLDICSMPILVPLIKMDFCVIFPYL